MGMTLSRPAASTLWIVLLTAASTATTLMFACATPFPSLAALAAVHMHRKDGIRLMLATWLASQIVGFGVLGYPHGLDTFGWAAALAMASVCSALAAYGALDQLGERPLMARLAVAYVAGFVAFKAVILAWAVGLGGLATLLDPALLQRQFLRDGLMLAGLFVLYRGLVAIGLPAARNAEELPC